MLGFFTIVGVIGSIIIFWFLKSVRPLYYFMTRGEKAKGMYEMLYEPILNLDTKVNSEKRKLSWSIIVDGNELTKEDIYNSSFKSGVYEISLKDKTINDLLKELEAIINDALSYSENLENIIMNDNDLQSLKSELTNMCSNVRMLQWQRKY